MAGPIKVTAFPPPPFQSPMFIKDPSGADTENVSWPWQQWLLKVTSTLGASTTVTGKTSDGTALKSLLQALQTLGLISDQTVP
jgi:hypothetical protein